MLTFKRADLQNIARQLLAEEPAPAVQVRLYREVLDLDEKDPALIKAKEALDASPAVRLLAKEQWPDGSWGRLHSRDRAAKQKIITTEVGVARALALGLTPDHPILQKTEARLRSLLNGETAPRDRAEHNERWPTGVQLFAAATLSQIQPDASEVATVFTLWAELARRTFAAGTYDPEAEVLAHRALTGAPIRNSYLTLNNRYTLTLLSARSDELPRGLERQLLKWIYLLPQGIKYLPIPLTHPPQTNRPGPVELWFAAHELMAGFPFWRRVSQETISWLWDRRSEGYYWDFGKRGSISVVLPLANNWRRPSARRQDWTARVVLLLNSL